MRRPPFKILMMGASLMGAVGLVAYAGAQEVVPRANISATAAAAADAAKAAGPGTTTSTEPLTAVETERWCGAQAAGVRLLSDQVKRRNSQLDEREQTLAIREAALIEATARLDKQLAALEAATVKVNASLEEGAEEREERVIALVKMVESNRAGSIAPMVGELEPELAVEVLDRMNRTKAGKLLAELPAKQAASLAGRLTRPLTLVLQ